jgi:hypothetical protein
MLRDVVTYGYPETALIAIASGGIELGMRGHKGYIVRPLNAGHSLQHPHPQCFELSFAVPSALSGSPLLLMPFGKAADITYPPKLMLNHAWAAVIGVCVGTQEAEVVIHSYTEIIDGKTEYREKTSRIELYGLAHDLRPLASWAPSLLGGATLGDVITHS